MSLVAGLADGSDFPRRSSVVFNAYTAFVNRFTAAGKFWIPEFFSNVSFAASSRTSCAVIASSQRGHKPSKLLRSLFTVSAQAEVSIMSRPSARARAHDNQLRHKAVDRRNGKRGNAEPGSAMVSAATAHAHRTWRTRCALTGASNSVAGPPKQAACAAATFQITSFMLRSSWSTCNATDGPICTLSSVKRSTAGNFSSFIVGRGQTPYN